MAGLMNRKEIMGSPIVVVVIDMMKMNNFSIDEFESAVSTSMVLLF